MKTAVSLLSYQAPHDQKRNLEVVGPSKLRRDFKPSDSPQAPKREHFMKKAWLIFGQFVLGAAAEKGLICNTLSQDESSTTEYGKQKHNNRG